MGVLEGGGEGSRLFCADLGGARRARVVEGGGGVGGGLGGGGGGGYLSSLASRAEMIQRSGWRREESLSLDPRGDSSS